MVAALGSELANLVEEAEHSAAEIAAAIRIFVLAGFVRLLNNMNLISYLLESWLQIRIKCFLKWLLGSLQGIQKHKAEKLLQEPSSH